VRPANDDALARAIARLERERDGDAIDAARRVIEAEAMRLDDPALRTEIRRCVAGAAVVGDVGGLVRCADRLRAATR
jgi:hypothetical protein